MIGDELYPEMVVKDVTVEHATAHDADETFAKPIVVLTVQGMTYLRGAPEEPTVEDGPSTWHLVFDFDTACQLAGYLLSDGADDDPDLFHARQLHALNGLRDDVHTIIDILTGKHES